MNKHITCIGVETGSKATNRVQLKKGVNLRFCQNYKVMATSCITSTTKETKDLNRELARQKEKLEQNLDKKRLKENTPLTSRPIIAILPRQTSLLVRAKYFIIKRLRGRIRYRDLSFPHNCNNNDKRGKQKLQPANTVLQKAPGIQARPIGEPFTATNKTR
ncbi:lactamase_B domain-containing protein [Trichonephila inaurata madagascariensis]|uniref:Lactamase_B domain-containing protein n=1 Tax=Trichonephila inaurata madagascariensis TaxID=2747483 RepID=A0A8X6IP64_9ARAC|nr:lactamase_B domain-containing protein [Trichonephila inaurata madagascariensis]